MKALVKSQFFILSQGGHHVPAISSLIMTNKPSWLKFKGVGIGDGYYCLSYSFIDGQILMFNHKLMQLMLTLRESLIHGEWIDIKAFKDQWLK